MVVKDWLCEPSIVQTFYSGIDNSRFKKVATHTLNPNQLSAGDDRRINHGINKARDAIYMANSRNQGAGILDNDYMAAFDYMVFT